MHINAQTKLDQMTMWLKKQRGHTQHAASTTTITTYITTSSPRLDLECVVQDVGCRWSHVADVNVAEEKGVLETLEEQACSLGIGPSE